MSGKVEVGETSEDAAYRELWEETGIGRQQLCLYRLMDITYYYQEFVLEMYVGKLEGLSVKSVSVNKDSEENK